MKLRNSILAISALLVLNACGDFLEPNSKSEFVPKDAVSLNELLLGEAYQRDDLDEFNAFLNLLDDDIEASSYQEPSSGFDANKYTASFTWQPDMFEIMENANERNTNLYKSYYELILGANAVIDYLPEVNDTEENINKVKAQAYALRGFYYLNLVNLFGMPYNYAPDSLGVPLKLHSAIEESPDYLARKTVREVYTQILSDLHTAEETYLSLPENEQWNGGFRTNLPMVQLVLSRTYLYMENWEKAAYYARLVMDNKNFSLQDLNEVPMTTTLDGRTINNYISYASNKSSETIWPYGYIKDMFGWVSEYVTNTNTNTGQRMHAYFQASEGLISTFDDFDLRLTRYIVSSPKGWSDEMMYMAYGKINIEPTTIKASQNGTTIEKDFYLPKVVTGEFGRCLRLSEAYMNYAEACAMMDNKEEAEYALNTLREKRFDPEDFEEEQFGDKDELIEFVRAERRRELCFEGHRWFDLRRWGMPAITHTWYDSEEHSSTYRLEECDLLYTIPIPNEAMQKNGKLVQNPLPEKRLPISTTSK